MKIFFLAWNNGGHRLTRDAKIIMVAVLFFIFKEPIWTSETSCWSAEYTTNISPHIVSLQGRQIKAHKQERIEKFFLLMEIHFSG